MDPDANLREQLELTTWLMKASPTDNLYKYEANVDRLCELVESLNGWISHGGFLPEMWRKNK